MPSKIVPLKPVQAGDKQEPPKRLPNGQFPPGVSGNPKGYKPGQRHFTSKVIEALEAIGNTKDGKPIEYKQAIANKVVSMALQGNEQMIKLIWNYLDGLPKQDIKIDDPNSRYNALRERLGEQHKKDV